MILQEKKEGLADKTFYELLIMYLDYVIVNIILGNVLMYVIQNNKYIFSLFEKLLKVFIGIILFSRYHFLPQEDIYITAFRKIVICISYKMS